MLAGTISKYLFRIRTRNGVIVEHLSFYGRDEAEARRKVTQIYNYCEILECKHHQVSMNGRLGSINYEDVVDLISAS
jgi:hypothetical protein